MIGGSADAAAIAAWIDQAATAPIAMLNSTDEASPPESEVRFVAHALKLTCSQTTISSTMCDGMSCRVHDSHWFNGAMSALRGDDAQHGDQAKSGWSHHGAR